MLEELILHTEKIADIIYLRSKNKNGNEEILKHLYKNLIDRLKGIYECQRIDSKSSALVLLRSFMEIYMYMKFILKEDTKKRLEAYKYFCSIDEAKKFKLVYKSQNKIVPDQYNEVLQLMYPGIKNIDDYINELKNKYKKLYNYKIDKFNSHKWYSFDRKIDNLLSLMKHLNGNEMLYRFYYSFSSSEVHGTTSADDVISSISVEPCLILWMNEATMMLKTYLHIADSTEINHPLKSLQELQKRAKK